MLSQAGHAVTYFLLGRPVEDATAARSAIGQFVGESTRVQPVVGSRMPIGDEIIVCMAGWQAE